MRLAYVVENYETFVVDEIAALRRHGVGVFVLNAFRPQIEADPQKELIRRQSFYFPFRYRGVTGANVRAAIGSPFAYFRCLPRLGLDGENLRMLALAAYYAREVRAEGITHIHGTFGTRTTTLASVVADLAGVPFSFTTHAYDIFRWNRSLEWKIAHAAFVRTISAFNKRYIVEHYKVVDPDTIHVRYLGVDLAEFPFRPDQPAHRPFRVVTVGRLTPTKGHDDLIAACDLLRREGHDLRGQIIGGGESAADLAGMVAGRGLQDVVNLSGPLGRDRVRAALNGADVFVLACRKADVGDDQDGIPVALMEAMALGVPVVSTVTSGIPELVEHGVSGLLAGQRDPVGLADAMAALIRDPQLGQRLRVAARHTVERSFNLHTNARQLVDLFAAFAPPRPAFRT